MVTVLNISTKNCEYHLLSYHVISTAFHILLDRQTEFGDLLYRRPVSSLVWLWPHSVLNIFRVRTGGVQGNQIPSNTLWTLGIPKI